MQNADQDILNAVYRIDLLKFAVRAMSILEPGTELTVNWHHKVICYHLNGAFAGNHRQLVINQPPKTLKTHLVSIASVAWQLIKNPELKIAIISHDEVLASKIVRSIKQIIKSTWYQNLAPTTKIKADKDTETVFETTAGGEVRAFSINGGITGHGFDIIIIDDPQKASTAHSETERKNVENAYGSAIANRWRNPKKGILIVVMQRLHVDDFTHYILKVHKSAFHLSIPAQALENHVYDLDGEHTFEFPEGILLEPGRMDEDYLSAMRTAQGSDHYEAQYLQNPQMTMGRILKPEWFKTYQTPRPHDYRVLSIDPAFTKNGGDHSAVIVVNLVGRDIEVVHAELTQQNYPAIINWIGHLDKRWKPDLIVVEAIGAGVAVKHWLEKDSIKHVADVTSHNGKSKEERMEMVSPEIEAGHLWLPNNTPWLDPFVKALTDFPYGKNDDWPDCVSQLFLYLERIRAGAKYHKNRRNPPLPPPGTKHNIIHGNWDDFF